MQITLRFDCEALSSNRCYSNIGRGRALTKEAKDFKKFIYLSAKSQLSHPSFNGLLKKLSEDVWIESTYYFYSPKILTKAKKLNKNKMDVSSCIKLLQDSIFEAIGADDFLITHSIEKQMQAEKPMIFVVYNVYPLMTLNDVDY